jgi:hypothetical protein
MVYFLGILEQKGLDAISEYARLIAEQLKLEKGDVPGLAQQIDDLNNIIAYENANIMNYYSQNATNKLECPGKYYFSGLFSFLSYFSSPSPSSSSTSTSPSISNF